MSDFNGMTQIELEMIEEELNKVAPALLEIAPTFASLASSYYREYRNSTFPSNNDRMNMAVKSAAATLGLGK
ncbi:hypothetical protein EPH95_02800 [Salicibibacter halophilus]|uniref:Uncharacterized protein n=1 Tax=Salicibibacter halophilus TaxID=2502791 RepID=A0A514LG52_9BACI|nr:hypothetical protein [Salicibibacter halophilus]QDI90231.1 hypothetical protein EPH95_02800 [Salicibibacter halophilus]